MGFEESLIGEMKALRRHALKLCRNADQADDLVQDTLVRAMQAQDRFEPGTNLGAWLHTIQRNLFLSGARRAHRVVLDAEDTLARTVPAANDQLGALIAKDAISFLAEMSAPQVRILLAAASGLPMDAIAQSESVPVGTIKSRLSRARYRLAELIGEPLSALPEPTIS